MQKYLFIVVTAFVLTNCYAQQLDSIKYANGYIYYHDYGKGEPVIILSGGPGVSCDQEREVAIEVGKNHRAILLEQRGTGLSIPTPFDSTTINLKSALDDLNLLLDHLKLKDAIFYGHSWGGTLAMSFATSYPSRTKAIILTGTGPWTILNDSNPNPNVTQDINIRSHLDKYQRQRLDSLILKDRDGTMTAEELTERRKIILLGRIPNRDIIDSIYPRYAVGIMNKKMASLMWQDLGRIHFDLTSKFSSYHNPFFAIFG
ncbi:MAG: alpha/beta hydrolase, partial [Ferruginibacter sp.]